MITILEELDKKTLALWSLECTSRVLFQFENKVPLDKRPRIALEILEKWTREYVHLKIIRKASLDAHAAARE